MNIILLEPCGGTKGLFDDCELSETDLLLRLSLEISFQSTSRIQGMTGFKSLVRLDK